MYPPRTRFLFALLLVLLLCSSAQATTTLLITVQDSIDNTTLPHATVYVSNANYARTNSLGQVYLTHTGQNDQEIKITKAGYDDWSQTVNRNTTVLLVNLSRQTLTFTVNLFDSDTLNPISGANVNLTAENVSQKKQTDSSGSATFAVTAATIYTLDVNAANYESRSSTIEMGTENQEVQYKLLSGNSFSFVVKDKDSGKALSDAEVRLNAILAGKTDERGILITPVTRSKTYSIEIKRDGYQTYSETRTISESDAIYYASLTKAPVGAFVYITDESKKPMSNAEVYVNGSLAGTSNEYGRMNLPTLVTGDYILVVKKSGYTTQTLPITISGQSKDYTFILPYESSALTVFVQDPDKKVLSNASITVDGTIAGVTDDNGQLITQVPFNTDVNISATKEGYAPASVKKMITQGNGTATVTIILEKNLDWGLLSMIAIGAIAILVLFAIIRILGRGQHHVMRRNEI
ncbi:MAG: carboxypeptidase regulatory-like domain-containing protein [Methanoregula sp.]